MDSLGLTKLKNLNNLYDIKESKIIYWNLANLNSSDIKFANSIDSLFGNARMVSKIKDDEIDSAIISEKKGILKLIDSLSLSGMPNP